VRYHFTFVFVRFGRAMSFVQENWMLIAVFVMSGGMLVWPFVQRRLSPVKDVNSAEATLLINRRNAVLLDVREAKEFEGGRLPGAIHIPLSQLGDRSGELGKLVARPVVAYCDSGRRSRGASGFLAKAGFKEIYSLQGGILAWKKDGLPVEK
jgi:rhodanese-related sulfurtransferase